ncbi:FUSC family protein [Mycobacterium sp. Y57]|uniref:FUSC family protein n=1 Tax=Mycolicibacterium xanthum TaxID=2796469 RepID=UPI001C84501D|nr:FUSC family protein [Mycolicibacterium xanthum]MBX7434684.1 FUSC family protein [Mycolicibacterium xanthum]
MIKGLTLPPAMPDLAAVLRSLLGVVAVAVPAVQWDRVGSPAGVAGAAAIAGVVALQDSPRARIPLVVATSLLTGGAVLTGALVSAYSPAFVAVAAVWSFAAAMAWALGANAGLVAAASVALLVVAPQVEPTLTVTLCTAALAVGGGLLQAALIAIWPQHRWRVQRDALTNAYCSLASDARRLADRTDCSAIDTEPLIALRAAFTVDCQARRRPADYRSWYGLPERIAATLSELAGSPDREAFGEVLAAAGDTLAAVAETRRSGRGGAAAGIDRFHAAAAGLDGAEMPVLQRLSTQLHEAVAIRLGDFVPSSPEAVRVRRPELRTSVRAGAGVMRSHLRGHSPVLRHALRLAVAVGVACGIARYADVAQGYWIPLTVLLVLRPETAHTYTRAAGRLLGTVLGIAAASSVLLLVGPGAMVSAALAIVFVAFAYVAAGFGYLALSAALAAAVVFLIDLDVGLDPLATAATMGDRLLGALAGGVLAVIAHVVLPDDELTRLGQRAGELLKTEVDYAAAVIKSYVHELQNPADALSAAWQRAFRARAAFEAAAGATRPETRDLRHWLRSYRTALNAVTASCTTLETTLPATSTAGWSGEFVLAVDEYVESLCGDPPTAASPWSVDIAELLAADQRLRDTVPRHGADEGAARVLVGEIGAITRNLSMIAISPGTTAVRRTPPLPPP